MDNRLYGQQERAFHAAIRAISDGNKKILIQMPIGMGKSNLILALARHYTDAQVLLLCRSVVMEAQYRNITRTDNNDEKNPPCNISITTYAKANECNLKNYDIVIADEVDMPPEPTDFIAKFTKNNILIALCTYQQNQNSPLFDAQTVIRIDPFYYIDENYILENFCIPLLEYLGFAKIAPCMPLNDVDFSLLSDLQAQRNGETFFFEIKRYRNLANDPELIDRAVEPYIRHRQVFKHDATCIVMLLCAVDTAYKEQLCNTDGIIVWDIKNLLYLCKDNEQLSFVLKNTVPFEITGLSPEPPTAPKLQPDKSTKVIAGALTANDLIAQIQNCPPGTENAAAIRYEEICADTVRYLFGGDFSQMSRQHKTKDLMFRMDLLCSIKSNKEFWSFLSHYYKAKFIVFETKNYTEEIGQNLIYITEKYLFASALRTVAIIMSRRGFDLHAQAAAEGILKENNKLIIDITDNDLIKMLLMKKNGKEPSDHLYDKV